MKEYEKKVIIGHYVKSEISGKKQMEYLRDEGCSPIEFSNESAAVNWIIQSGRKLHDYVIRTSIGRCFRCGNALYPSDIEDYTSQCFLCDEDFYSIEQETEHGF